MDKVQKIRKEVEKLHGNPYYMMAVKDALAIIDSLQEEPSKFDAAIQEDDDVRYNEDLGCRVNLSQLKRVAKKEEPVSKDYRERYKNIAQSDAFQIVYQNKSLGEVMPVEGKEPVSIWHDSNKEQPNFATAVAIWNPKYENGEILSRCTEVYSDRIWAYIDDLLKM